MKRSLYGGSTVHVTEITCRMELHISPAKGNAAKIVLAHYFSIVTIMVNNCTLIVKIVHSKYNFCCLQHWKRFSNYWKFPDKSLIEMFWNFSNFSWTCYDDFNRKSKWKSSWKILKNLLKKIHGYSLQFSDNFKSFIL